MTSVVAVGTAAVTAGVLLFVTLLPADAQTNEGSAGSPDPGAAGPYAVSSLDYTLGDAAFRVPGYLVEPPWDWEGDWENPDLPDAEIELTGNVHYPTSADGPSPLVVLLHGYWTTCADREAADIAAAREAALGEEGIYDDPEWLTAIGRLMQWPCVPGVSPLPSYRGYDYLAQRLASHGMVVVSISANGVNAGSMNGADNARSLLINKHLELWSELTRTGGGELAGRFTDPQTGTATTVDFTGRIDLSRVGTMGHSRGGRAVAWHAADVHRDELPAGVRIAGVLSLAAAGAGTATNEGAPWAPMYRVTSAPLAVWMGWCDSFQGEDYIQLATGASSKPIYSWYVDGANHNFLNTQWSPSSGQVTAHDDFEEFYGELRPGPGLCFNPERKRPPGGWPQDPDDGEWDDTDPADDDRDGPGRDGSEQDGTDRDGTEQDERDPDGGPTWNPVDDPDVRVVRQLTEEEQRQVHVGYATAFFRHTLLGDDRFESVISGEQHPYAAITDVDASRIDPQR